MRVACLKFTASRRLALQQYFHPVYTPTMIITNHQSPITNHQSPITNHQSLITPFYCEPCQSPQGGKIYRRPSENRKGFDGLPGRLFRKAGSVSNGPRTCNGLLDLPDIIKTAVGDGLAYKF